jgi:D-glycerate 3-kinase
MTTKATPPVLSDSLISPIITFIESFSRLRQSSPRPLVLGISGPQGSGKTTLVSHLVTKLSKKYRVIAFSIDDIYLPHEQLAALGRNHPDNKLLQHRGEPGTHDVPLGIETLDSLISGNPTPIPSYDKSQYDGAGDRVLREKWITTESKFDIVLFEGWCVGFSSLSPSQVAHKQALSTGTLKEHSLSHLLFVNSELRSYQTLWERFDALVWLNAQDIQFVYGWRLEQEHAMKKTLGRGMTDEQVKEFVDGYMPAYELYLDGLMKGELFAGDTTQGRQTILRIDYDRGRRIVGIQKGVVNNGVSWTDL